MRLTQILTRLLLTDRHAQFEEGRKKVSVLVNEEQEKWCDCDWPTGTLRDGKYFCGKCSKAIECDLCDGDNIKQAQIENLHYLICEDH